MKRPKIRSKHGPEYGIQNQIRKYLIDRGWHVERIIGNAFQSGLPDLYAAHPKWGQRWIEVKNEGRYEITKAQRLKFPILAQYGVGVWILVAATEKEYDKLFAEPNWEDYWKDSYGPVDIDNLLDGLIQENE